MISNIAHKYFLARASGCLLIILFAISTTAQQHEIDSLKSLIATYSSKGDTMASKRLMWIGQYYNHQGMHDSAIAYETKALSIALGLNFTSGIAKCYTSLGQTTADRGDYTTSLDYYAKALSNFVKLGDKASQAMVNMNIGAGFEEQDKFPEGLQYLLRALAIEEEIHDSDLERITLYNVGGLYVMTNEYGKALTYFNRALVISEKLKMKKGIASAISGIGAVYLRRESFDTALSYLEKAYKMYQELNDQRNIRSIANNIGIVWANKGDIPKALEYYNIALEAAKKMHDKSAIADNTGNIGMAYYRMKNYKEAEKYVGNALDMVTKMENIHGQQVWNKLLSEIYDSTGQWQKAYLAYKNYTAAKDSMESTENTRKIVTSEMNYEYDKKQAAQKADEEKRAVQEEADKHKQRIITEAVTVGLLLSVVFAAFILRSLSITRKQKKIIELKNAETDRQKKIVEEKQKEILDSILYARRIQKALLASDNLLKKNLPDYFVLFKPKDIVSGDFYWAASMPGVSDAHAFYLAVCDSTGHGVPGAFMSLLNISFLNEAITEKHILQPSEVFNHARKRLIENISQEGAQDGMDGVLFALNSLNNSGGKSVSLNYCAAFNAPVIVRNSEVIELSADRMPVGASPVDSVPFTNRQYDLQKGDMLYAFSDGFSDQFGGQHGKKFKYKQVLEALASVSRLPLAAQKERLEKTFDEWKGNLEQVDDLLVIGIKI